MKPRGLNDADLGLNRVGIAVFVICLAVGGAARFAIGEPYPVAIGAVIGLYFLFGIKVANQWEKVAALRLGKYIGLRGPGLFLIIPVVDSLSRFVDQRGRLEKYIGLRGPGLFLIIPVMDSLSRFVDQR